MPAIAYVFRRGAVYHWRRRLPANQFPAVKSSTFTASLLTKDQTRARSIAFFVAARFNALLLSSMRETITDEELRHLFAASVVEATSFLDRAAMERKLDPDVAVIATQQMLERAGEAALRVRIAHGLAAYYDETLDHVLQTEATTAPSAN